MIPVVGVPTACHRRLPAMDSRLPHSTPQAVSPNGDSYKAANLADLPQQQVGRVLDAFLSMPRAQPSQWREPALDAQDGQSVHSVHVGPLPMYVTEEDIKQGFWQSVLSINNSFRYGQQ